MIALTSGDGNWLKTLRDDGLSYVYHPQFGFVSESQLEERTQRRARAGLRSTSSPTPCRFRVSRGDGGSLKVWDLVGCETTAQGSGFQLKTPFGVFGLALASETATFSAGWARTSGVDSEAQERAFWKYGALALLFFLSAGLLTLGYQPKMEEAIMVTPVRVTVVPEVLKKQKAVTVPSATDLASKLKIQDQQTRRAVQQNLGFLGLIGKKDLSRAMGGMPSTVRDASAGAGAGGKEGSGGEYLVGLGQGVRRATVGNTGVAGLGGIGTKGAGGGAGGYGNSLVGSGEGKALSKVALSQELSLEGGLDRSVIQATIAKYLSQVRACYEQQLQANPGLAGQVTMGFSINGEGSVSSAQVARSTLGNAATESCISSRMMSWKFPKPVGGVTVKVNYPFLLRPAGA